MNHIASFKVFEGIATKNPEMENLLDSVEGKDLAALPASFRVAKTGRVHVTNMGGKTYFDKDIDNDGNVNWYHISISQGRSYNYKSYPTPGEAIRELWKSSIQRNLPAGAKRVDYLKWVDDNIDNYIGKQYSYIFNDYVKSVLGDTVLAKPDEVFASERWNAIFSILGMKKTVFGSWTLSIDHNDKDGDNILNYMFPKLEFAHVLKIDIRIRDVIDFKISGTSPISVNLGIEKNDIIKSEDRIMKYFCKKMVDAKFWNLLGHTRSSDNLASEFIIRIASGTDESNISLLSDIVNKNPVLIAKIPKYYESAVCAKTGFEIGDSNTFKDLEKSGLI